MANLLGTLITGNLRTTQGYGTSDSTRILYPGGGSFVTTTSVITGAIRIKMPVFGSGMMMTCTVKVYEYSSNKSFTITFGGHRDSDNWYNIFCYFDGDGNRGDLPVRFGLDDGVNCVWIGETSNQWIYPQVFVTDVQMGYVGYSTTWLSGWSVGFVTSFGTVNRTATAFQKITTTNIGSQSVSFATSSGTFSTNRTNYKGVTDNAVAGQLMWKNYGNSHTIFDASNSTSPTGGGVNNANPDNAWTGTYPTLMGWNGANTYGVRVDSSRIADSIISQANSATITATTSNTANAIVLRDSAGDIYSRYSFSNYVNTTDNDENGITRFIIKNGDNYHRSATTTVAADIIKGAASGTWSINVTGSAGSITNGVYTTQSINNLTGVLNFGVNNATPYNDATGVSNGIAFGGIESSSLRTYGIFTELENIGGNYSKLTLNYHTGIRIGASTLYGGTRFYNNFAGGSGGGSEIFSVGNGDSNVRVANNLYIGSASGWITDLLAAKQAAGSYVIAHGTGAGNIDADWGQSFKTFDPIPSGTPPLQSPNIRTINVGDSYSRRTQLAFDYASDVAYFRRRTEAGWFTWREFIHSGNIGSYALPIGGGSLTTGASSNLFIGRNSTATSYNAISLNGNSADSSNMGLTGGGVGDSTLYINSPGNVTLRTGGFSNQFSFTGGTFNAPTSVTTNQVGIGGTGDTPISITGAMHKYIHINPGAGWEAMVRYDGSSGNSWYVGKRTTSQVVGTESFHFYSAAAGATVGGINPSGDMIVTGSMRAPIFYDSQDTGYYGDFASTSRFNATITNTSYFGADSNKGYAQGFNTYSSSLHKIAYVSFDWNGNYDTYSNHGISSTDFAGNFADSVSINSFNDITFRLDSNNNNADSYVRFMNDTTGNNTFSSIGYNGSTYYASFSRDLYVTGNTGGNFGNRLIIGATTTPHTLQDSNVRPTAYLRGPYPVLTLDHTVTNNVEHGPTIQFTFDGSNARQWVIGCGGSGNHMDFGFSSSGYGNTNYNPHNGISGYQGNTIMRIIDSRVGIGGDWGAYGSVANPEHTLDVRGTIFSNTDVRAPIFYDSQDTAFYVDPNSSSRVRNLYVGDSGSNWVDTGGWGTQFHVSNGPHSIIRVYARDEAIQTVMFSHNGGQSKVGSGTNHDFAIVRNFSDRMTFYSGYTYANGYLQAADSLRAPIFYDSQDTTYYLDPNSTSRLNVLSSFSLKNNHTVDVNHAYGMYFDGAGDNGYAIFRESGSWVFPYPDLRISFHTGIKLGANASYNGIRFYTDTDMGTQVMSVNNGSDALGAGNVYVNNSLQAGSSLRAPIFYDSENTGYYGDFGSTSVMNAIRLGTSTNNGTISGGGDFGVRITTDVGFIQFGPANSSYAHIYTDRPTFYFNRDILINNVQVVVNSGTWAISVTGSAGGVDWYNVSNKPAGWLNQPNLIQGREPNSILQSGFYESYLGSGNPTGTWFNYINVRHSNTDNGHGYQIGMSYYDNNLWFRSYQGAIAASFQPWSRALGTNTDPYPSNMDQYVRTSDSVSFLGITSPTILVNNHSDNTKGYRIHNTSGTSVSAMFTNSSNQLVIAAGAVDQINLNKKVYVNGVALGVNIAPSATAGRIDASNDIVAFSSSDERLKGNITPIANALDKVKSLTGVEFDWKPEHKEAHGHEGRDTGIIAQQVLAVIPTAVRTNDTGFLAVRYEKLIGLLIEGMKEQQEQIDVLKAKLDGLTK